MLDQLLIHVSRFNIILLLLVSLTIYYQFRLFQSNRKIRALGGHAPVRTTWLPFGIELIYNGVKYHKAQRNLELWLGFFHGYGNPANPYTIEATACGQRVIFTADPENIKAVLATQFQDFGKGKMFNEEWHDFLGDSIFTTDLEQWHDSRQLIRPQFVRDRLSDLEVFERHVGVLIEKLAGGEEVELVDLFFRYTLDAATDFLLGRSVDSLQTPQVRFANAFAEVQRVQAVISRSGPLNRLIPRAAFHANLRVINEFVAPYIEEALVLSPAELEQKTKSASGYTFLHALARFTRDRTVLRDQLVAVLLAGRDTTACTLSWLFFELSRNARVVRALRREVLDVVGLGRAPTYAHLKSMRYLQHTLNETLRLYPVVPFNVRVALRDTSLPHGGGADSLQPIGVLAGSPVGYSTLVMQRRGDGEIYPDPRATSFPPILDFVPERWAAWTPKPWTYLPFNGGPRICVGQQFALTEMAYTVVRILQRFERVEGGGEGEPGLKAEIVLQPARGVKARFWREGESE
ncbi:hypothetical protein LTR16_003046 [Cryomyces antarcticus]|uniref:Uncharacterized protein n=1 Tax=Cryomyces antarcticus TaxID=329879 RepID=A0ABR0LP53_9PEZI|nr:hypothetical protein LTR39_002638 [Cryomyces antarcticus]KAK5016767.1 hypothetical protein LTR60_002249 [Cryomyces antarcticus]KAK5201331.1 hypothetical protein LTR16_003046 [Cryomyces antarcticus]